MLCPLCGEPALRIKSRLAPIEKVNCSTCGKFKISNKAVLIIRQQIYKMNFEDLVISAQERIKSSKKTLLIDAGFVDAFRINAASKYTPGKAACHKLRFARRHV